MSLIKKLLWPFFQGEPTVTPPYVDLQPSPKPPLPPRLTPAPVVMPKELKDPPYPPLTNNAQRMKVFGAFDYESDPISGNPEHIRIRGDWQRKNIIWVPIPQLRTVHGAETQRGVFGMEFHQLAARQLQLMWAEWEQAGLIDRIKTFEGSFAPRFVRGSDSTLSNHCFGNAFDINYDWNKLGQEPAGFGHAGSVRELVPISIKWGFYWGGFYHSRKDGMHFEVAKVMP